MVPRRECWGSAGDHDKHGVLLIFDEVVTGFRVSPGAPGFMALCPSHDDGKILACRDAGRAVGGPRDSSLARSRSGRGPAARIHHHHGTHNAHPVSAAAGIATLKPLRDSDHREGIGDGGPLRKGCQVPKGGRAFGGLWRIRFYIYSNPGQCLRRPGSMRGPLTGDSLKCGLDDARQSAAACSNRRRPRDGSRILSAAHTRRT